MEAARASRCSTRGPIASQVNVITQSGGRSSWTHRPSYSTLTPWAPDGRSPVVATFLGGGRNGAGAPGCPARLDPQRPSRVVPLSSPIEMTATLRPGGLTLETVLVAGAGVPGSVNFGTQWRLKLPALRRLLLEPRGIPTGEQEPFAGFEGQLGKLGFDDGFALSAEAASFSLAGAGRLITLQLFTGYP